MDNTAHAAYHHVRISVENGIIEGDLQIPPDPKGLVIFTHGDGSSRHSARNQYVARKLEGFSFATLLPDLLTSEEDNEYSNRFNIPLLTQRLIYVTRWVHEYKHLNELPIGYFGAAAGAASAIWAASRLPGTVKAVVSLCGRPDLAMNAIPKLKAPTLLVVAEHDHPVLELNLSAYEPMVCEKKLKVIEGASRLFKEAGKLGKVAEAAAAWYLQYFPVTDVF